MKALVQPFLSCPYKERVLIGSATTPEVFTVTLDHFNCVTFIETILALALSNSVGQFVETLRQLRYRDGQVEWAKRHHYMTDWIKHNARQGFVRNVTRGPDTISHTRTLSLVEGLPPQTATFKCFPKRAFSRLTHRIADGDLIFFVSTRKRLDVFHTGLLFRGDDHIVMVHASRSQGLVAPQRLTDFLKQHRMAGVILVRPATAHPVNRRQ